MLSLFDRRTKPAPVPPNAERRPPGSGPSGAEPATFAAGCFWGVEAAFRGLHGVVQTAVGFTGGHAERPGYRQVCTGRTGHAEAVEVWFDAERVTYDELLDAFWRVHNPTTRNRQGFDLGSQYRSAIFTHSDEQQARAEAARGVEQERRGRSIVTEIVPAPEFHLAEEYHQRYLEKQGRATCSPSLV